jgi:hypothetical protein
LYSLLVKGFKTVVVEFVDMVHGTGFLEIMHWKPLSAIPVEIVDVLTGTDSSGFPEIRPWRPRLAIPVEIVEVLTGTDSHEAEIGL